MTDDTDGVGEEFVAATREMAHHIRDARNDTRTMSDDTPYDNGFDAGMDYAVHLAIEFHLTYCEAYDCDCPFKAPVELDDGSWECLECGDTIVGADENILRPVVDEDPPEPVKEAARKRADWEDPDT